MKNKNQDCFDPGLCSNDCTGLVKQINPYNACTENYINEVLKRAGVGKPSEIEPEGLPPIGSQIQSYTPNPDDAPVDKGLAGVFSCFTKNTPNFDSAKRKSLFCGLIYCVNETGAAIADINSCGCGGGQVFLVERDCGTIDCPPDKELTQNCDCVEFGEGDADLEDLVGGVGPTPGSIIDIYERAISIRENAWGVGNPNIAILRNNLGVNYYLGGKPERAIEIIQNTSRQYERTLNAQPRTKVLLKENESFIETYRGGF